MRWIFATLLLALPAPALANLPPLTAAQPVERPSGWYGWQILLADSASIAAGIGVGTAFGGQAGGGLFGAGYLLGGPVVHVVRGRGIRAAGSLILRLGGPVLGFVLGGSLASCSDNPEPGECRALSGISGAGLGMLASMLTDALALAWEPPVAPPIPQPKRPVDGLGLSLLPSLGSTHTGAGLGLVGRF